MCALRAAIDEFNKTQTVGENLRKFIALACEQYMEYQTTPVPTPSMYAQVISTLKPEYCDIFADIYSSCERINYRDVHAFLLLEMNRVLARITSPYIVMCCHDLDTYVHLKYLDVVLRHAQRTNKIVFVMTSDDLCRTYADIRTVTNVSMTRDDVPVLQKLMFAANGTDIDATFSQLFADFSSAHKEITIEYNRRGDVSDMYRVFGELLQHTQTMIDEQTLTAAHALRVMREPCVSELVGLESDVRRVWAALEHFFALIESMDSYPILDVIYMQDLIHCGGIICTDLYKLQDTLSVPGVQFHAIMYGITDTALRSVNDAVAQIQTSDQVCICTRRVMYNAILKYLNCTEDDITLESHYTLHERLRVVVSDKHITNTYEVSELSQKYAHTQHLRSTNADAVAAMNIACSYKGILTQQDTDRPDIHSCVMNACEKVLCQMTCNLPPVYRIHAPLLFCVIPLDFIQDMYVSDRYWIHSFATQLSKAHYDIAQCPSKS